MLVVFAFVALLPWRASGATCPFAPAGTYAVGQALFSVAIGDIANGESSVWNWVAVGDINGDGRPDLATGTPDSSAISILLGNAFGTFTTITCAIGSRSGVLRDLNGDGRLDLAVVSPDNTGTVSIFLNTSPPSTRSFTDDPLTTTTRVKAVHVTELRTAIDGLRARHPISPFVYSDSSLNIGGTQVKAIHFVQLRSALDAVYDALGIPRPVYTDPAPAAGATTIKRLHVEQIRNAVRDAASFILTVSRSGTGSGTVTSVPAGLSCGAVCAKHYLPATAVTLTAAPAAGSVFAGWSGACAGTGTCQVPMSGDTAVTATFALPQVFTLNVTVIGTGTGTITSIPAGITCGADCVETYPAGTSVRLVPSAPAGSYFSAWGNACAANGDCIVPMTSNAAVVAQFMPMAAIDVQPRDIDMGTVRPCDGGVIGAHFYVNALPGMTWTVTWSGSEDPSEAELSVTSGTGPGGTNFLVTVPSQTPSGSFTCADFTNMGRGDSFIFTFTHSDGRYGGMVFTGVTWTYPYLP